MKDHFFSLIRHVDTLRQQKEHRPALSVLLRVLRQNPNLFYARIKIGQILREMGEVETAGNVLTAIARHLMRVGLPLMAAVAIRQLKTRHLIPYNELLNELSTLYAQGSDRISHNIRLPGWNEDPELDVTPGPLADSDERLVKVAAKVASLFPAARRLPDKLPAIPFLSVFDRTTLRTILDEMEIVEFVPGGMLINEGEVGDELLVLVMGQVRVLKQQHDGTTRELATLGRGAVMGEISLLTGAPRNASIVAVDSALTIRVPRTTLHRAQKQNPRVFQVLRVQAVRRILINVLRTSELFRDLTDNQKTVLLKTFRSKHFGKGDEIITEGQRGEGLYLLLTGRATVYAGRGAQRTDLAVLNEGEIFGEISLIMDRETTATVQAQTQVHTLFLPRKEFNDVMVEFPKVKERIASISDSRMDFNAELLGDFSSPEGDQQAPDSWTEQEISDILLLAVPMGEKDEILQPPAPPIDLDENTTAALDTRSIEIVKDDAKG